MKTRYKVLIILGSVLGVLIVAGMVALTILSIDEPPPDVADLEVHRVDVADEENGYTYLREAGKVLWWPGYESGAARADAGLLDGPSPDKDPAETAKAELLDRIAEGKDWDGALADEVLAHNSGIFGLIEKTLACPHFQAPPIHSLDADISEHFDWISLERLQAVRAWSFFKHGREEKAFGEALNIVHVGHRIQGDTGTLVPYLIGTMLKSRGLDLMRQMLPAAGLDSKQLKGHAEALSVYDDDEETLGEAFRAEFQMCMGALQDLLDRKLTTKDVIGKQVSIGEQLPEEWFGGFVLKPNQTRRFFAEALRSGVRSASKPYSERQPIKPAWLQKKGVVRFILSGGNLTGKMLCGILLPGEDGAIERKSQAKTETCVTRVLLAMKVFKIEKSRLPETLEELVPGYLDAVPRDDFDGKPLRYNAEKKVVYSVGEDLKDGGGMTKEEQKAWWIKENPWIEEHPEEEEYNEPDIWEMPDPSWTIEF